MVRTSPLGARDSSAARVAVSTVIDVEAPILFDAIRDPRNMARWSPESTGAEVIGNRPPRVGERFKGRNRIWFPWRTDCRVIAASSPRIFSFDVSFAGWPVARWTYEFHALSGGATGVTETWDDRRTGFSGRVLRLAAVLLGRGHDAAGRNRGTMRATLAAMKAEMERDGGPSSSGRVTSTPMGRFAR